jgi:F0F1-type ATP synthase assembly protein I
MADVQPPQGPGGADPGTGAHQAWSTLGYLIAGIGFWGFVGWLVDRWLGLDGVATAVGVLAGAGGAIYLIVRRSGI